MDKPSKAALILALGKPKGEEAEEEDGGMEGKTAAASALLAAIKSDDPEAVAAAFSDLYDMC